MKWSEVSIEAEARETDLVAACFYDVEATGVVLEDLPDGCVTVRAYLPVDDELDGRIAAFRAGIAALAEADGFDAAACPITSRIVQDSDWENNWKAYFHTQRVGKRIVIQPTWETYTPLAGDVVIRIDPESAFGTGTHPTTAMCLRALETLVPWIRKIHVKDADATAVPGTWGTERPWGEGQVGGAAFIDALNGLGFTGNMTIEREGG